MKRTILFLAVVLAVALPLSAVGTGQRGQAGSVATADAFGKYTPPVTVTFARNANSGQRFLPGESYTNNVWVREFEEVLGIRVETIWEAEGDEAYQMKLNIAIATKALPDLIQLHDFAQLQRLVEADLVEDLTGVYERHASPLVRKALSADGGSALQQVTFNGKLMAYPGQPAGEQAFEWVFIRDDLRRRVNMAEPKTMEDVIALARAFKAQGLTAQGFAFGNNIYDGYMGMKGFFNAYDAYPTIWFSRDGSLRYGSVQPEMKSALTALHTLYREGLIDADFVAKDNYAASQDAVAGRAGVLFGQWWVQTWPLPDAYIANNDADWRAYPIPFSRDSTMRKIQATANIVEPKSGNHVYAVRKGYANPEVLAKLHNFFMEKRYGASADLEKYGTVWADGDEYNIFMLSPVQGGLTFDNYESQINVTRAIDAKDESMLVHPREHRAFATVKAAMGGSKDVWDLLGYKLWYGPTSIFGHINTMRRNNSFLVNEFYGAETPEMQRRWAILRAQEQEAILKIITGAQPISYWDEFVSSWMAAGGLRITEEVNAWATAKR